MSDLVLARAITILDPFQRYWPCWTGFVSSLDRRPDLVMTCRHKRAFETQEECEKSIALTDPWNLPATGKLYSYLCEVCGKWHKTKHDQEGRRKWLESVGRDPGQIDGVNRGPEAKKEIAQDSES
jgi:hypothetical protein